MTNWGDLAKKLLSGKDVTLHNDRHNYGTQENPDIVINEIYAGIETSMKGFDDIVVYFSQEDDDSIFRTTEIYRLPVIKDWRTLAYILRESDEQFHTGEF